MCIFISDSMSKVLRTFIVSILQMRRNRCLVGFYILHCTEDGIAGRITFRCRCHIQHCLRQNNLGLRHSNPFHSLGCRYCHSERHRICISHIFRSADHNPSCNKFNIFSCIQHFGQIIHRGIRIRSPHTFNKCGNRIVMIISRLIITYHTLLDTFRSHIQCKMDLSVAISLRRQDSQLHCIQCVSCVSPGDICQEFQSILLNYRLVASHSFFYIIDCPAQ